MAKESKSEVKKVEHTEESRKEIIDILGKCEGRSRSEVLKNAPKLNASERLKLINYFEIDPKKLGDTIVFFWLHPSRGQPIMPLSDNPDIIGDS